MLNSEAQGATGFALLDSADHADTAAASTTTGVDVSEYEGHLVIIENVGVVTGGTVTGKLVTDTESDLSTAVDVSGATFTVATTSTDERTEKITVECNKLKKYLGYVGTIVTGPAQVAVVGCGKKKYST